MPPIFSALAIATALVPLTFISAAIVVPFTGTLVRYRANYDPRRVQLDGEEGEREPSGPKVDGYWSMMKRTKRLEGWAGLYKGFMPTVLSSLFFIVCSLLNLIALDPFLPKIIPRPPHVFVPYEMLFIVAFSLFVGIPATVITNRAICTPYVLPFFSTSKALHVLLTPTERRRPWKLWLTPGLLLANLLIDVIGVLFVRVAVALVAWNAMRFNEVWKKNLIFAAYAVLIILASLVMCPLQVMIVRLSLQRNHDNAATEENRVEQESFTEVQQGKRLELKEYCTNEEVMGFRDEFDPYKSLYDCFTRMRQEEGWKVLYRAYWVTLLSQCGGAGASVPAF